MTRNDIEKLKKMAVEITEMQKRTGLCNVGPMYNFEDIEGVPSIHVLCEDFYELFKDFKKEKIDIYTNRIYVKEDGVTIYALERK